MDRPIFEGWSVVIWNLNPMPLADAFRPGSEPNLQSKFNIHITNEEGQNPDDFDGEAVVPGLTLIKLHMIWHDMTSYTYIHIYSIYVY